MRTNLIRAAAILALVGIPAYPHRLDEYLQATIFSVEKDRIEGTMILTPGVAVFPVLFSNIDANTDGIISQTEEYAYAERVLHDLSLSIDGHRLTLQLVSIRFATRDEMQEGLGQILLEFYTALPPGGRTRNVWSAAELQAKNERDRVGLRKCIRPLLEGSPPGQDGMRYALFPFS